ncbi:DNA adenine methylase [Acetobacterium wieringae]|uniref:DNA adenine methylase n=1 Tax=Acetobacterium wieringae TaxID=52694 RepID=UPI002033CF45|nr:DNA adenine methylase [Acetobacterium wieringae]URN85845.1 DNA adenine methylase [Acetobacterium wieringae]
MQEAKEEERGLKLLRCVLKYPGAKWRIAEWISYNFCEHNTYLEPFFGSGAVFFSKKPSERETINDIDGHVVNFFEVLRDYPEELARKINLTPYSRQEFQNVEEQFAGGPLQLTDCKIENARRFAVRCFQGFGSKQSDKVGWKNSKKAAGPDNPSVWSRVPETLLEAAKRLKMVQIEKMEAVDLIKQYNHGDCLIYADPPYLKSVRNSRIYRHEMMGDGSHIELIETLLKHRGPAIVSGYDSDIYNELLRDWSKKEIEQTTNSATTKTEVIWMNYKLVDQISFLGGI